MLDTHASGAHLHPRTPDERSGADREILIVRDGDRYRLLHGQLRLVGRLSVTDEVPVDIRDEGMATILRGREGLVVQRGRQRLPLCRSE